MPPLKTGCDKERRLHAMHRRQSQLGSEEEGGEGIWVLSSNATISSELFGRATKGRSSWPSVRPRLGRRPFVCPASETRLAV